MYNHGQMLTEDKHFEDHISKDVPVQIYLDRQHDDIGFVQEVSPSYVKINNTYYNRRMYDFISRPGY